MAIATRLTCYALISSLEEDLRHEIHSRCLEFGITDILPSDVRDTARRRRQADAHAIRDATEDPKDFDLLPYIDFADLSKAMHSSFSTHSAEFALDMGELSKCLDALNPIRNRVCHTRPLEMEDLPHCHDTADALIKLSPQLFSTLANTLERLKQGSLTGLVEEIPSFWSVDDIQHNLPVPDFDETTFLGRTSDKKTLRHLLKGAYPVITIVGEGGVGKTALALRSLYDLLDDPKNPYEAIVWVTLKTTSLTGDGIREVRNSIRNALDMYGAIADELGTPSASSLPVEELISEIAQYLETYKILVAIDNLETVQGKKMHALCDAMPIGSKLLLTSRIGLMQFETRYQLKELDRTTAISLMRRFAGVLQVEAIVKGDAGKLGSFCKTLYDNPLLIKWFVSAVSKGASISTLLSKGDTSFKEALEFCFRNVFEDLDSSQQTLVDVLVSAQRPISVAELRHLSADLLTHDEVEMALGWLKNSSTVREQSSEEGILLALSGPAGEYLHTKKRPDAKEFERIQRELSELQRMGEKQSVLTERNRWNTFTVHNVRTRDERVTAIRLRKALAYSRSDISLARKEIEECKRSTHDYCEVYRIAALLETREQDLYSAGRSLDEALEHDPNSDITRFQYVQFQGKHMHHPEEALAHINILLEKYPDDWTVTLEKATTLKYMGKYQEAVDVYESVLASIEEAGESGVRRVLLIARDQTADCYKRMIERDTQNRDKTNGPKHIQRGLKVLSDAIKADDWDDRTRESLGELFRQAVEYCQAIDNTGCLESTLDQLDALAETVRPYAVLPFGGSEQRSIAYRLRHSPELNERVKRLANEPEKDSVFDKLEKAYFERTEITGRLAKCARAGDGKFSGFMVDVGIRAFLPASQVDVRPIRHPDSMLGKELSMRVVKVDRRREDVIVSRRALLEEANAEKKKETLATLTEGKVLQGTVKSIADYGAFVDIGGLDGLLHVSNTSVGASTREEQRQGLRALFKEDEEITVKVVAIDSDQRVSLEHIE